MNYNIKTNQDYWNRLEHFLNLNWKIWLRRKDIIPFGPSIKQEAFLMGKSSDISLDETNEDLKLL
jgi:hypothetical protein